MSCGRGTRKLDLDCSSRRCGCAAGVAAVASCCCSAMDCACARFSRRLRRRGRARGPAVADRAVEGRAAARDLRRGEAARGRAFADRARRQRRRQVARAARRAAVFLVRRGQVAGRRERGARRSRATARRPSAARSRATSSCAPTGRRGRARRRAASGRCATPGIARPKTCSRPGSRSCSTIRWTRRRRGRRCTYVLRDPVAQRPVQPSGSRRRRR